MSPAIPRACVIGWPVRHSRSPMIHGYWLSTLGIAGDYVLAEVAPDDFAQFVKALRPSGFVGANVTLPHKEAAFALCERRSATAEALGAVNTLWFEDGVLCGDNTDVGGFLGNLDAVAPGWDENVGQAVVLGAGGAARGVLHALGLRGIKSIVLNRTLARAQDLCATATDGSRRALPWEDWRHVAGSAGLVVNTTSLGMAKQPPLTLDLAVLPGDALVTDIVYVPLETAFLAAAKARRLRTVDGLGMLLHQAVPGFEHWFGVRPQVTAELRALVVADIQAKT
jgi:shikimate dehydrogenase